MTRVLLIPLMILVASAGCRCSSRLVRGDVEPSPDGKTRLIIDDDNGGQACSQPLVDGRPWTAGFHVPGEITPGEHVIECGSGVAVDVAAGTTFRFNYWGP